MKNKSIEELEVLVEQKNTEAMNESALQICNRKWSAKK